MRWVRVWGFRSPAFSQGTDLCYYQLQGAKVCNLVITLEQGSVLGMTNVNILLQRTWVAAMELLVAIHIYVYTHP